MTTSKPSIMDENPNLESFYRNLSLLATAALAVHISWTTASPSDCFVDWLVSAIPTMLTGFFLFGLLLYAAIEASDTQSFTLIATSTRSGHAGFRISSDPDREDRHLFNFQVITYTASLGVSIDLVYGWYLLCQVVWDDFAKRNPTCFLIYVTLFTGIMGIPLLMAWMPVWNMLQTKRHCGGELYTEGSEDGEDGSSPGLKTLIAAAEAYEKELRSQLRPSHLKVKIIGATLNILRKW